MWSIENKFSYKLILKVGSSMSQIRKILWALMPLVTRTLDSFCKTSWSRKATMVFVQSFFTIGATKMLNERSSFCLWTVIIKKTVRSPRIEKSLSCQVPSICKSPTPSKSKVNFAFLLNIIRINNILNQWDKNEHLT